MKRIRKPNLIGNRNAASDDPRNQRLNVRLTAGEMEELVKWSSSEGVNIAEYARGAIKIKNNILSESINPC